MAGEDQERFEDYLELEHYIEELQVGRTAHPPSELTPTRARIYRMVALFRSASTEEGQITISKGSSLNLIDDVAVTHIIGNGSWVNGVIKPAIEPGAPTVNNLTFNSAGQSMTVGPFNTAGTYHLYCSVHPNMNLTIIVQ